MNFVGKQTLHRGVTAGLCTTTMYRAPPGERTCRHKSHYSVVKPGRVSSTRHVPSNITKPHYVSPISWLQSSWTRKSAEIKPAEKVPKMRDSCKVARHVLDHAKEVVRPGVTTDEIDVIVHNECIKNNAYPSPLLYKGFPKSVCTSVNNVACHGIPDDRPLENGDIINIDVTVFYNGYHGDLSETYFVGDVDDDAISLVNAARACRDSAIDACGPDVPLSVIGGTISSLAEELGVSVIEMFCGHGIGENFHEPPDIIHIANIMGGRMKPGMTFTIEPVLSQGDPRIEILEDGWTAVSLDNSRSANFEHTILITEHGCEILTDAP